MPFKFFLVAFAIAAANLLSAAQAAAITYTLAGEISGSADFTPFNNAAFTWTITGDTTQKQLLPSGFKGVPAVTSALDITGAGSFTTLDPFFAVAAPSFASFGFTTADGTSGIGFQAPALASYDGTRSIGPTAVTFTGSFLFATAQGPTLFIVSGDNLLFQAVSDAVPEPLTLALFGAGLAGIGALCRKRKALA